MTTRTRTIDWEDPREMAARGAKMAGLDYLHAMIAGEIPPPPIVKLMGITMVSAEPGFVIMKLAIGEYLYNPIGSVHGGVAATLLDSVMGCAVHSVLPQGRAYSTLEIKISYLRAITDALGEVTAEGRVVNAGPQGGLRGRADCGRRRETLRHRQHNLRGVGGVKRVVKPRRCSDTTGMSEKKAGGRNGYA